MDQIFQGIPFTDAVPQVGSAIHSPIAAEHIAKAIARRWQDEANTTVRMLTETAVYVH